MNTIRARLGALVLLGAAGAGLAGASLACVVVAAAPSPPPPAASAWTEPAASPPPAPSNGAGWVPFDGDVVAERDGEVTLRDRSGATVVMDDGDVRSGASGLELRLGAKIVALMVESADPSRPGLQRAPVPHGGSRPAGDAAGGAGGASKGDRGASFGCFGFYRYDCDDGTFAGFCVGHQTCGQ